MESFSPKNYLICTVQRSGKSWLCGILTHLKHFGAPEEYLRGISRLGEDSVDEKTLVGPFLENGFSGIRKFVQHANAKKTGHDSPIGLAIQSIQLQLMADRTGLTPAKIFTQLHQIFDDPIIFLLKREDLAAQAVSHYFSRP